MKPLVLDGHLSSKTLVAGLRGRGFSVSTLQDLSLEDSIDPDVARQADDQVAGSWVLVTMDLTIIEDYPGFDWNRYAIAWVKVAAEPRGAPVEAAKHDIVHRHADRIAEQGPGDHFTYLRDRFYRHPPSLVSRPY